jgi:hypothetical protein
MLLSLVSRLQTEYDGLLKLDLDYRFLNISVVAMRISAANSCKYLSSFAGDTGLL